MSILTRRQFIEWTPARLAIEISRGIRVREIPKMYFHARKFMRDSEFVEKIKLLMTIEPNQNIHFFVKFTDQYLPLWMFEVIISSKSVTDYNSVHGAYNLVSWIKKVNNILLCLHRGFKPEINWVSVYPLSGLRELKPWVLKSSKFRWGFPSNDRRAIMGIPGENYYIFNDFVNVKRILLNGGLPDIWWPQKAWDMEGFEPQYVDRLLIEGWFIVLNVCEYCSQYGKHHMVDFLINRLFFYNMSYMLFSKNFKYGDNNSRFYGSLLSTKPAIIAHDIEKNPSAYELWYKAMVSIGMMV